MGNGGGGIKVVGRVETIKGGREGLRKGGRGRGRDKGGGKDREG